MTFLDYFQVSSVVIVILVFVGRVTYLRLRRNINSVAIGRGKKGLLLAIELVAVIGLFAWMSEVLLYAFHSGFRIFPSPLDSRLLNSLRSKNIGVALITLGLIIFGLAYVSLGDSWRVGFDVKTPGALVTNGIFAVSRNPIYVFLDLWFIGIFLINGTLIFLIFAVLCVAALHWQILQEEEFLAKLYGETYRSYSAKTGRYFHW